MELFIMPYGFTGPIFLGTYWAECPGFNSPGGSYWPLLTHAFNCVQFPEFLSHFSIGFTFWLEVYSFNAYSWQIPELQAIKPGQVLGHGGWFTPDRPTLAHQKEVSTRVVGLTPTLEPWLIHVRDFSVSSSITFLNAFVWYLGFYRCN